MLTLTHRSQLTAKTLRTEGRVKFDAWDKYRSGATTIITAQAKGYKVVELGTFVGQGAEAKFCEWAVSSKHVCSNLDELKDVLR